MFDGRDFERVGVEKQSRAEVVVMDCVERDYTVITVRCRDRPKLLFDTICTITEMQYVVFHGTVSKRMFRSISGIKNLQNPQSSIF